ANSWMQTPAGYAIAPDGRFVPTDWWAVIFNPSFPYRLVHMVLACSLAVALLVGSVAAWHLLRDAQGQAARVMFSMAMWMAAIVAPLQVLAGDQQGLNTAEYQPAKVAAMEGDFATTPGSPLVLFGMPDAARGRVDHALEIPHAGALILTHSWNGAVRGLDEFPRQDWPPLPYVFWAFRAMVGLGVLMIALGWWSLALRPRGRIYRSRLLWRAAAAMGPAGFLALLAGWTVTEVGRQPFTVFGLMRTADSASPIALAGVAASLAAFVVVYFIVFGAGFLFMARLMLHPPAAGEAGPPTGVPTRTAGITPMPALGGPAVGEAPAGGG
ncbi:MAG: cytochrome ubiquinol oxidase subunit I, partial [Acetobacteraceae bacterium]